MLSELVDNELTHAGPTDVLVRVDAAPGGGACLEVSDRGCGIPAAEQDRVFRPYERGQHSAGAGLGLYLVRTLTTRLHARLELATAPGRGSTFTVVLPDPSAGPPVEDPP